MDVVYSNDTHCVKCATSLYPWGMNDRTLAQRIQDRIDTAYSGVQADFARALGVSTSTVNAWLKGRIALPQLEIRRRLANELGVRHVELFVLAGELDPSEIGDGPPPPFPPDDPRAAIMDALRAVTAEEAGYLLPLVESAIRMAHRQEGANLTR